MNENINTKPLTIGELARRGNVATSLLRYYQKENLLQPVGRTDAGYRIYDTDAEHQLRFIRSAQRYGFSLNDIRMILGTGDSDGADIVDIAEKRFLEIERRVTEMLVLRHELELFLDDVAVHVDRAAGQNAGQRYRDLVEQICGHENHHAHGSSLNKLLRRLGCNLADAEWEQLFANLRGRHVHIWRKDDGYTIRFPVADADLVDALEKLVASEIDCDAHGQPELTPDGDGYTLSARGDNAFLFAQLFMALEVAET
jgi:DNA-binding transcriptional MerR regulator